MSSNPVYIGPGYWTSWHIKSLYADDFKKKSETARNIVIDIIYFPCMGCRNHAKEYVRNHPLDSSVKNSDPYSLFKWTVDFHNTVNLRLGKTMINWEQAKKMWSGENVCFENCGMEDEKEEEKKEEMTIKNY